MGSNKHPSYHVIRAWPPSSEFREHWTKAFARILQEAQDAELNPKYRNYLPENLLLERHLCLDLLVDAEQKKIVCFSGVFNGQRYPTGVYRVLNRFYISKEYRKHSFKNWGSQYILPQQIQDFKKEISVAFISRENIHGKYFLKKWIRQYAPSDGWQLSSGLVPLLPELISQSTVQYIAYKRYTESAWPDTTYSEGQWKDLPESL